MSGATILAWPREAPEELLLILGRPNFWCAPYAHLMRDAGLADIPRKAEAEQAYVIHLMVTAYLEHGDEWQAAVGAKLNEAQAIVDARKEARP